MVEIDRVVERLSVTGENPDIAIRLARGVEDDRLEEDTIDLVRARTREEQATGCQCLECGAVEICVRALGLIHITRTLCERRWIHNDQVVTVGQGLFPEEVEHVSAERLELRWFQAI